MSAEPSHIPVPPAAFRAYLRKRTQQAPRSAIGRCERWSEEAAELWPDSRIVHGIALARRAPTVRSAVLTTHAWIEGPDGQAYDPSWRQYASPWPGKHCVERRADLVCAPFVVPVVWPALVPSCPRCWGYKLDGERCLCGVGPLGYVEHYVGRVEWLAALEVPNV